MQQLSWMHKQKATCKSTMPLLWMIPTQVKYQSLLWYYCGQAELHPHCGFKAFPPKIHQENILLHGSSQSVPTLWFHWQTRKQPTSPPPPPPFRSRTEDHTAFWLFSRAVWSNHFIVSILVFYAIKPISGYPSAKTKTKHSALTVVKKKTKNHTLTVDQKKGS